MYIVNAPFLFQGLWGMIKGFLNESTQKKIAIKNSNFYAELSTKIHPDNIPSFLGGNCTCEEHGGCEVSNAGPWQGLIQAHERLEAELVGEEIIKQPEPEVQLLN